MIIWRMEHENGKGAFQRKGYLAGSCRHIACPTWGQLGDNFENICGTEGKYLNEWFLPSLPLLIEHKCVLLKLSVPKDKLIFAEKQVLFQRKDAKVLKQYSPTHIKKFTMKYYTPRDATGRAVEEKGMGAW